MKGRIHVTILLLIALSFSCKEAEKVKEYKGSLLTINSEITGDSAINSYIMPYKHHVDSMVNRTIGNSAEEMRAKKPESKLSNFVADIMQNDAKHFVTNSGRDAAQLISLVNVKGLRAPIPKGNITVLNIFELMPFENEIVLLTLSAQNIQDLFEFFATNDGDGIAGATAKYKNGKLTELLINGKPLDNSKEYYLATSDYLAKGGDYYSMITKPQKSEIIGIKIRDAIIAHIENLTQQNKTVEAKIEGRLIFN